MSNLDETERKLAPKKASIVKPVVAEDKPIESSLSSLLDEAKKYGLQLKDEEGCVVLDGEDNYLEFSSNNKNYKYNNFTFKANQLPHCCGMIELGEFSIHYNTGLTSYQCEELDILIAYALLSTKQNIISGKATTKNLVKTYGLIICCNGLDNSAHIKRAIKKYLTNHFKVATTFENKNSGNILTIFVSVD